MALANSISTLPSPSATDPTSEPSNKKRKVNDGEAVDDEEDVTVCGICLEGLLPPISTVLCCRKQFHHECIEKWGRGSRPYCPLCRHLPLLCDPPISRPLTTPDPSDDEDDNDDVTVPEDAILFDGNMALSPNCPFIHHVHAYCTNDLDDSQFTDRFFCPFDLEHICTAVHDIVEHGHSHLLFVHTTNPSLVISVGECHQEDHPVFYDANLTFQYLTISLSGNIPSRLITIYDPYPRLYAPTTVTIIQIHGNFEPSLLEARALYEQC